MTSYKKLAAVVLLCCPMLAVAQSSLDGQWQIAMTPPGGSAMEFDIRVITADSLQMVLQDPSGAELALEDESLVDNKLHFVIPTGHGTVTCDLFHKEDTYYAGLCLGPMGEGATTLKRVAEKDEAGHRDNEGHQGTPKRNG